MNDRAGGPGGIQKMAVGLSIAKGSLKKTTVELGITPQILTRWRRAQVGSPGTNASGRVQPNLEQQEIQCSRKELKQAESDQIAEATQHPKTLIICNITMNCTKKAAGIFSRSGRTADRGKYFDHFGAPIIKAYESVFPVETGSPMRMCRILKVRLSSYYISTHYNQAKLGFRT